MKVKLNRILMNKERTIMIKQHQEKYIVLKQEPISHCGIERQHKFRSLTADSCSIYDVFFNVLKSMMCSVRYIL